MSIEISRHSSRRMAAHAAFIAMVVAAVACGDSESTNSLAPTPGHLSVPDGTTDPHDGHADDETATAAPVPTSTPLSLPAANAPS
jgi:hypothetical protein